MLKKQTTDIPVKLLYQQMTIPSNTHQNSEVTYILVLFEDQSIGSELVKLETKIITNKSDLQEHQTKVQSCLGFYCIQSCGFLNYLTKLTPLNMYLSFFHLKTREPNPKGYAGTR